MLVQKLNQRIHNRAVEITAFRRVSIGINGPPSVITLRAELAPRTSIDAAGRCLAQRRPSVTEMNPDD